ncbi:DUF6048 family protein [Marinoscillum furvescens]|uniref:Outer membrane protein with beta-barrel domain n=1 Tax=Marinoscillum furvescens DSM 4134 TaxID=1122208 RepID=A0A3D9L3A5_MARFU|nr:DUF6048 family protein [Marinoscillum furvescens]RED98872.1 hypothetical protein C7460_10964 [Marinoscillum furvescens DSM 4134]
MIAKTTYRRYFFGAVLLLTVLAEATAQGGLGQRMQSQMSGGGGKPLPREPLFEKRERDWKPSMLKLSADFIPLGQTAFADVMSGWGVQAAMDFDIYFLSVAYGHQASTRGEDQNYTYQNSGNYFMIGPETNLLKNDRNGNSLTFGLKYGRSWFSDEISFRRDSTFFGSYEVNETNPGLTASWMEMNMALNVNVWKGLYMGYTVRYKFFRNVKGWETFAPYDVPGFGLYEDNTGVQFNYYIGWAFRWREKFPPLPEVN